ncbi:MAG: isoprenylcysteine carboxylmethyltransferase family protein [Candidatus Paceibacterota bacterium]|jgi:protein-S-isoprenylcysteine O-methyltransferase Ste14
MFSHSHSAYTTNKKVSAITFYPPLVYFGALLFGIILDILFPLNVIPSHLTLYLGVPLLLFSPLMIFFAQRTARKFKTRIQADVLEDGIFHKGIYKYSRNPTYLGLTLMLIGFGLATNMVFVVIMTLVAFSITHRVFLKHEEKLLEEKYGELYGAYKKKVRSWI